MMFAIAVLKVRPFPMCRGIRRVVAIVVSLPKKERTVYRSKLSSVLFQIIPQ